MLPRDCELVIFDWDGTVVDSTPTIAQAILSACSDIGVHVQDPHSASYVIGLGLQDALARVAPGITAQQQQRLIERFRHHYLSRDQSLKPFPGITDVLADIQKTGLPLAVATGKSRAGLDRSFEATQTGHFFQASRCADETDPKPAPTMVFEICEELSIDPAAALVIGDTTHDIFMARSAGACAVAVGYGAHRKDELLEANPVALMNSVAELHDWVKQWITK
jgi:phosphoglycolate phosphatase